MTIQDKLNELTKITSSEFELLVGSTSISKNFTRYQKALDNLSELQLYIKQNNLDANAEITMSQKAAISFLR